MTTANLTVIENVLFKRGNTAILSTYTGVTGEVLIDTTLKTLRVQDGVTAGGTRLATYAELAGVTGNVDLSGYATINQITAANLAITSLQSNAAIQATLLDTLTGNAATQSQVLDTLTSNAATQANTLSTLLGNAITQQTSLIDLLANAATQAQQIANAGSAFGNANVTTYLTAVSGNIIPAANVTYSLGNQQFQWSELWVSNNTIYIGNTPIRVQNGQLLVNNAPVSSGPVQPYLELTDTPFITQPIVLGSPVAVSTAGDGSDAEVEVVIGAGPTITSVTVTTPGTNYIVGQRYRVWSDQIGGSDETRDSIDFQVANVGVGGGLVTIANVAFIGAAENTTGTYSNVGIQLRASPDDVIDDGLTLVRSYRYALFNIEAETEYDNDNYTSPLGTEWNSEGWGDLTALNTRTYTTFHEALDGAVGENIIGAELVMHDTANDRYYKFSFSNWGGNNGGSYAYTRTLVEDPNYFRKTDYGNEVDDVFMGEDQDSSIGITRDNNGGIYNYYTEEGWDEDVSPEGTLWNTDGWDDLTDVAERTYVNLYAAFGDDGLGNKIVDTECVMSVPSIGKYYAVKFLSWTQNNAGGGFSYTRREIDLDQLNEGVRFADGTVQKTAYVPTNVKLTAPGDRRIEEVAGYKSVSVTEITLRNLTATASRNSDGIARIWIDSTATTIAGILNDTDAAGITDNSTVEFSLDNTTWYNWSSGTWSDGDERGYGVALGGDTLTYSEGDTVYFRYVGGGAPVTWWDRSELPSGSSDFRGAVIDYHAYIPGRGTIVGTIHIVDDSGDENITHTEVSSGTSDLEYSDLWYVTSEGRIRYRQLDGDDRTLKIQWTAKVFYGSEYYDD